MLLINPNLDFSKTHPMVRRLLMVSARLVVGMMDYHFHDEFTRMTKNYHFSDGSGTVAFTSFFGILRSGEVIPLMIPEGNEPMTLVKDDEGTTVENVLTMDEICALAMRDKELKLVFAITKRMDYQPSEDGAIYCEPQFRLDAFSTSQMPRADEFNDDFIEVKADQVMDA